MDTNLKYLKFGNQMAVNPGNHMAAAVDAEIASYREMQNEIEKMRTDQQILMGQENENEMVKQVSIFESIIILTE